MMLVVGVVYGRNRARERSRKMKRNGRRENTFLSRTIDIRYTRLRREQKGGIKKKELGGTLGVQ